MDVDWHRLALLLQDILDYFGFDLFRVPIPRMRSFLPHHKSQDVYRRSIIRRIGSACRFIQINRIYLQPHLIGDYGDLNHSSTASINCANFGDIGWVIDEQHDSFTRLRSDLHSLRGIRPTECSVSRHTLPTMHRTRDAIFSNTDEFTCSTPDISLRSASAPSDPVALDKITALEEELVKLREVIASIATVKAPPDVIPRGVPVPPCTPGPPSIPPPPPPPGIPPPPPPPPPPMPPSSAPAKSVSEVIAERKKKNGKSGNGAGKVPGGGSVPSMTEVLKNLGTVKLKSVSRSPGGTPLPKHDRKTAAPNVMLDPQALIAAALKRKFAHRATYASPEHQSKNRNDDDCTEEKENSFANSFSPSPVKPEFGQHLLKSRNTPSSPLKQLNFSRNCS